jgi:hypothetical protein
LNLFLNPAHAARPEAKSSMEAGSAMGLTFILAYLLASYFFQPMKKILRLLQINDSSTSLLARDMVKDPLINKGPTIGPAIKGLISS